MQKTVNHVSCVVRDGRLGADMDYSQITLSYVGKNGIQKHLNSVRMIEKIRPNVRLKHVTGLNI